MWPVVVELVAWVVRHIPGDGTQFAGAMLGVAATVAALVGLRRWLWHNLNGR